MKKDVISQSETDVKVRVPETIITEHLSKINDPDLYKLLLYIFWRFEKNENQVKYITLENITADEIFCENFGIKKKEITGNIQKLLHNAVKIGILINCKHPEQANIELYFYNSTKNEQAVKRIEKGDLLIEEIQNITLANTKPNIFRLYEENIGPLTPLIAETIQDAARNYPLNWIEEAIQIAVENNVRRWKYIQAILNSWKEEGRNARRDQKDSEEDREKYLKGKYSDLIKH